MCAASARGANFVSEFLNMFTPFSRVAALTLLASGALLTTAAAQFTINAPTTDWVGVAYAPNVLGDPSADHQTGQGEADIVGNTGTLATSLPAFYTKLVSGGTPTTGTVYFRIRVGGDQSPTGFKSVALIGLDANRDGKLDLFLGVDNSGQSDGIYMWRPGTGLNISPSTTSIQSKSPVKRYTTTGTNYHWGSVTSLSSTGGPLDPTADTAQRQDFNSATGTDFLLSFAIPFQDLVAALGAQGITFNSSSVSTYVMGTATQSNAFNQDLNGTTGNTNSTLTWGALGVLSQPMSPDGTILNSAPVNTVPGSRTANGSLSLSGVSVNDPDGNLATVKLTATNGTVSVNLAGGAAIVAGANGSSTVTIGGTPSQINAALATLGFTATTGYTGAASVTVLSTDTGGLTDSDTIAITVVSQPNTAPVANADTVSTHSGKAASVYVIGNDTDADGNILTITSATLTTGSGTVSALNGFITYTPPTNFTGTATISYAISDGFGGTSNSTLTVTVAANSVPVAVNDTVHANPNSTIFISVLNNDSDADGDTLTITAASRSSGQGSVAIAGTELQFDSPNSSGTTVLSYTISDGSGGTATASVTVTTAANVAPVAVADTASTNAGSPVDIDVLANDTDANNDALTISDASVTTGSGTALAVNGKLRFAPAANFTGVATLSYTIDDGHGGTASAAVTVTVTSNSPPTAVADSYSVAEDGTLNVAAAGVLANDSDPNGNSITAVLVSGVSHGALTLNADGSFTYTPAANYNGADSFTYKANDGALDSNTVTVSLTVTAVNDAPVALADSYSTAEDTALTVATPGVLGNDSDVENSVLNAVLVSGVSHGTLTLNANGSFTYTPAANYNGPDSFTYKANDGGLDSNVATVSLTVTAVNDAPVASADGYTVAEDGTLTVVVPGVLGNDSDAEGSGLAAVLVSGVSHGTLTLNANGSFTYTPAANYSGPDSFTYKANDGALDSNVATVSITVTAVNDAPVAAADSYTVAEDNVLTVAAPGVLGNDSDIDSGAMTVVLVSGVSHGSLALNGNGSFTYTPATNYNGPDSFTYKANDGALDSNVATVSITVTAVNDAPVAFADSHTTTEDNALTVAAPGVLGNDSDADGNGLSAVLVSGVSHGVLSLNANGSFSYTPASNYNGPDSFTYKANDGALDSNVVTVAITVTAVNDAPVAVADSYTIAEDDVLTVAAPGVLDNDSDVDGNALSAVLVSGVSHGVLSLNANGSFSYTPASNYSGPDSFSYKVNDGLLDSNIVVVSLTVSAVNDAPVAVADSHTVAEDDVLTVAAPGVLGNDGDVDGDGLTAVLVSNVGHGTLLFNADGSFTYAPAANYSGPDSFSYKANDGLLDSNIVVVSLTVSAVNDAPVAVANSYTVVEDNVLAVAAPGVLGNDSDADGNALSTVLVSGVSHGVLSLNADGSFNYTPTSNYSGTDSFTYKVNDGTLDSNVVTVSITVSAVNDAPVATADSYTIAEDGVLTVAAPGLLGNDNDPEGSSLATVLVSNVSHGTLTLNPDGSFDYTPAANYRGPDSFSYKVSDGTLDSNVVTVSLAVTSVNDAPSAAADTYGVVEDHTLTVVAPGVLGNDGDVDGDALSAVLVSNVSHGTLVLNANGAFTYTPSSNYSGSDSFTYRASDGSATSGIVTVSIDVTPESDTPAAAADDYSLAEDGVLNVAAPGVLGNDSEPDGGTLNAVLVSDVSHGTLTLQAEGAFVYTPTANYHGPDSFTYKANNGSADSEVVTVSITVTPVNDAPAATADSYSVAKDGTLNAAAPGVLGNDSDADGDSLVATLVSTTGHGTLVLNPDGSFTYTPQTGYTGPDSFTYKANDNTLESSVVTVSLTVTSTGGAPVANNEGFSLVQDTVLTKAAPGVLGNDNDPEANPLTAVLVTSVAHGTLALNANGSFTYTPAAGYHGSDSFTYKANDGTLDSAVATVTLNVIASSANRPPVLTAPGSLQTRVATPITFTVTATDPDSDPVTITFGNPAHGTISGTGPNYTYTPGPAFAGPDSFTVTARDGHGGNVTRTIRVTVFTPDGAVGNYAFFLYDSEGEIGGHVMLVTTKFGRATGVLTIGGIRYTIRGFFGGAPTSMLPRSKGYAPATLRLSLDETAPSSPEIVIRATDSRGTFTGHSPRSPYGKGHAAPQAGRYTIVAARHPLVLQRTGYEVVNAGDNVPSMASVLTVRVLTSGAVVFNGYSGSRYALTCSSYLMPGSQVPFYAGRENLGGGVQYSTMQFPADPAFTTPDPAAPAVSGVLRWMASRESRIATPVDAEYPVLGGHYTASRTGAGVLNAPSLTLSLDIPSYASHGQANPYEETRPFAVNLLPRTTGDVSTVRVTLASGLYIGRVMGRVPRPFFGVIIQGEGVNRGVGGLLDFTTLGTSELRPSQQPQ
jgi:VCBS repeat-containing protein